MRYIKQMIGYVALAICGIGLGGGILSPGWAADKLNMADISTDPALILERYTPLMAYLKAQGLDMGKFLVYPTPTEAIENFRQGKFDVISITPSNALQLMDEAGAVPLLIAMKGGVKEYNSVIFVNKESPIQTLADLQGQVVAFESEFSTSSCVLPKNVIQKAGLVLEQSPTPVSGKVAYYFTEADVNTVAQVKEGKRAQAGGIQKGFLEGHPDVEKFRILAESPYVPRLVVLVRKGVEVEALKKVLLQMNTDPAAQEALQQAKLSGFTEFEGDPVETMTTTVRDALTIK